MRAQDNVALRHLVSDGLIAARKPKGPDPSRLDSPQRISAATAAAMSYTPRPVEHPDQQLGTEVLGELVAGLLLAATRLEGGHSASRDVVSVALTLIGEVDPDLAAQLSTTLSA